MIERRAACTAASDARIVCFASAQDLFDVAGDVTRAGSRALALARPAPAARDAPAVARLRAAGAIILGRTATVEFAFGGVGTNPHYGTPKNPWGRDDGEGGVLGRVPGGSSAGAGVAVADQMGAMGAHHALGGYFVVGKARGPYATRHRCPRRDGARLRHAWLRPDPRRALRRRRLQANAGGPAPRACVRVSSRAPRAATRSAAAPSSPVRRARLTPPRVPPPRCAPRQARVPRDGCFPLSYVVALRRCFLLA